jgi:replicative DNA helicase
MNMDELALPPHSVEAEQAVLGGLLLDNRSWDRIADKVTDADFYRSEHRVLFRHMRAMLDRGEPVDVITVAERVEGAGDGGDVGLSYLVELVNGTPSAANIHRYADILVEKRGRRELLDAGHRIIELATATGGDPDQNIQAAQALVMNLNGSCKGAREPLTVHELLPGLLEDIEKRIQKPGAISGLSTGFAELDRLTCGLQPGDLIIVAGRPSMGKTTLATNIAENVSAAGKTALMFSMEMNARQLVERSVSRLGGISTQAIRNGDMHADDYDRLSVAIQRLHGAKLLIDDDPASTPSRMRLKARKVKQKFGGLDLVVIDYLQLLGGNGQTRNEQLGSVTREIKLMARELDVPVILLSQLNRALEQRSDKRPLLSDLRESGAIEQDADVVLMCHRDEYFEPDSPYKGLAEILIRKQRNGAPGEIWLRFQGEYSRFSDVDASEMAQAARARSQPATKRFSRGFDS